MLINTTILFNPTYILPQKKEGTLTKLHNYQMLLDSGGVCLKIPPKMYVMYIYYITLFFWRFLKRLEPTVILSLLL
jgi:hypothetical protein